jgi:hypothetical protein
MTRLSRRLRAAFFMAALLLGPAGSADAAQIEVPAYRALGASLTGLSLLATIPAATQPRLGYLIQAQCAAGLTIALDDAAGALAPTLVVLAGPSTNGGQGGSLSMAGMPHTGRIRVYSSSSSCQMAARVW